MKKVVLLVSTALILASTISCNMGTKKTDNCAEQTKVDDKSVAIFNGKDFTGWRGYNRQDVPARWVVEDECIKFNGSGGGEAQSNDGGDLIFDQKFKNFELELEWKVAKGSNSGIFYLAQEIDGQPIYISAPE